MLLKIFKRFLLRGQLHNLGRYSTCTKMAGIHPKSDGLKLVYEKDHVSYRQGDGRDTLSYTDPDVPSLIRHYPDHCAAFGLAV